MVTSLSRWPVARATVAIAVAILASVHGPAALASPAANAALAASPAIPPAPHVAMQDAPLLPDYYALAIEHTQVHVDPRWQAVRLRAGREPSLAVLPVQAQGYGFSPHFRALVAAQLDRLLADRHLDANTQTDVIDAEGPFVRRLPAMAVDAVAAAHAATPVLALYVGHGTRDEIRVTLSLRPAGSGAGAARLAARRFTRPKNEVPALKAVAALLPGMLDDLRLVARPTTADMPATAGTGGCVAADWELADLPRDAPRARRACQALIVGILLPDYVAQRVNYAQPNTPVRLAWLAAAWADSDKAAGGPLADVHHMAAIALQLGGGHRTSEALAGSRDPVVGPLARLLWARPRAATLPAQSRLAAVARYVADDLAALPPFASGLARAVLAFPEPFETVDLCPSQLVVAQLRRPVGCAEARAPAAAAAPATRAQSVLLEDWRIAQAYKTLDELARIQADRPATNRFLANLPDDILHHPLFGVLRWLEVPIPRTGAQADYEHRWRDAASEFLRAVATLQRDDYLQRMQDLAQQAEALPEHASDPALVRLADDACRLRSLAIEPYGAFPEMNALEPKDVPALFLVAGSYRAAARTQDAGPSASVSSTASGAASAASASQTPAALVLAVLRRMRGSADDGLVGAQRLVARYPRAPGPRARLAIEQAKLGQPLASSRHAIDDVGIDMRPAAAVEQSNAWIVPADIFMYASEERLARVYLQRAAAGHTGSSAEMAAQMDLALYAGNLPQALALAEERLDRYNNDGALTNVATLRFYLGRPDAWGLLLPRLANARTAGPWVAALAGHRLARHSTAQVAAWFDHEHLDAVVQYGIPVKSEFLSTFATLDRRPADTDLALLAALAPAGNGSDAVHGGTGSPSEPEARARLQRWAMDRRAPDIEQVRRDFLAISWPAQRAYLPLYALVAWRASGGHAPELQAMREVPQDARRGPLLSKAVVLALDGRDTEALAALDAARLELSFDDTGEREEPYGTRAWHYVLTAVLLAREKDDARYRTSALLVARARQRIEPWTIWPDAAVALLAPRSPEREAAACLAMRLDAGSWLLEQSGLRPDPASAACRASAR